MVRLWLLAKIGETFHVLPSAAARALDEDPERTDLTCASLLGYASVKRAYDRAKGDDDKLKHIDEDQLARVRKVTFLIHQAKLVHKREHQGSPDPACRYCRG